MSFKFFSIINYFDWLLKKYAEEHRQHLDYRIVERKYYPSGQCKVLIQVIGKSMFMEVSPQEIVIDDRLLEGFSKKDIRTISYLAYEQIKKPKYKIIVQEFCDKLNGMSFKILEKNNSKVFVKTASQISVDQNLINGLSQEDLRMVSYIAGYEHSQTIKDEIDLDRKNIKE